jgi:hypothetical protein
MNSKIYVVVKIPMGWDNIQSEVNVKAFKSKVKAEKLRKELEESVKDPHLFEGDEEFEVWDEAMHVISGILSKKFDQFLDEQEIPYERDQRTSEQHEIVSNYIRTKEPEISISEIHRLLEERFPGRWSREDVKKKYDWEEYGGYPPAFVVIEIPYEE